MLFRMKFIFALPGGQKSEVVSLISTHRIFFNEVVTFIQKVVDLFNMKMFDRFTQYEFSWIRLMAPTVHWYSSISVMVIISLDYVMNDCICN